MEKENLPAKDIELVEKSPSENLPEVVEETPITLANEPREILGEIKKAETKEELESLEEIFKLSMAKKELARVATQSELMDKILEQAKNRVDRAGELSNKELLDYYNAFDNIVSRSTSRPKKEDTVSPVQITKNDVTINMDSTGLNREGQNRVLEVLNDIISQVNANNIPDGDEVIDAESTEESEERKVEND